MKEWKKFGVDELPSQIRAHGFVIRRDGREVRSQRLEPEIFTLEDAVREEALEKFRARLAEASAQGRKQ